MLDASIAQVHQILLKRSDIFSNKSDDRKCERDAKVDLQTLHESTVHQLDVPRI